MAALDPRCRLQVLIEQCHDPQTQNGVTLSFSSLHFRTARPAFTQPLSQSVLVVPTAIRSCSNDTSKLYNPFRVETVSANPRVEPTRSGTRDAPLVSRKGWLLSQNVRQCGDTPRCARQCGGQGRMWPPHWERHCTQPSHSINTQQCYQRITVSPK